LWVVCVRCRGIRGKRGELDRTVVCATRLPMQASGEEKEWRVGIP
jgi:Zn-finger nucleic acid-binding protein